MVKHNTQKLDDVFLALADSTRRSMLENLRQGEQRISDLAAPYDMSLAAASKHIKKLEAAGLVTREIIGRTHICRLNATTMAEADAWIKRYETFWTNRLDDLETILARTDSEKDHD